MCKVKKPEGELRFDTKQNTVCCDKCRDVKTVETYIQEQTMKWMELSDKLNKVKEQIDLKEDVIGMINKQLSE